MRLDITWHGSTIEADLIDGLITVGGGENDGIALEGLPPALVELHVTDNTHLVMVATCRATIGRAPVPLHVARLVLDADRIRLAHGVVLERPPTALARESRQRVATAAVAKALLQGAPLPMAETRAATLTCVSGADLGRVYPLAFSEVVIGRADDVDVRVHDRAASRQHATLQRKGRTFEVFANETTNGLFLNGRTVRRTARVETGDVLELGQTALRFTGPEEAFDDPTVLIRGEGFKKSCRW